MICTIRCYRWIVDSPKSIRCEEYSFLHIPPDPNETSTMARHAPTQYSSDREINGLLHSIPNTDYLNTYSRDIFKDII